MLRTLFATALLAVTLALWHMRTQTIMNTSESLRALASKSHRPTVKAI